MKKKKKKKDGEKKKNNKSSHCKHRYQKVNKCISSASPL